MRFIYKIFSIFNKKNKNSLFDSNIILLNEYNSFNYNFETNRCYITSNLSDELIEFNLFIEPSEPANKNNVGIIIGIIPEIIIFIILLILIIFIRKKEKN